MLFLLPGWARARDVDYRGTPTLFVVSDASAGPSIPTSPCVSDPQGPAGAASIPGTSHPAAIPQRCQSRSLTCAYHTRWR